MNPSKDNFSARADLYVKFRPRYPDELYNFLYGLVRGFDAAWDCGTGNGQVAARLSQKFHSVCATDISESQLAKAVKKENISYVLSRAEKTDFHDNSFDIITIGQAIHWFDFDAFYKEAKRVAKSGCIIAAWGYNLHKISPQIDEVVFGFYKNVTRPYWDMERVFVENDYRTIPFSFKEITTPSFEIITPCNLQQLTGYINTWSGVQNYIKIKGCNPTEDLEKKLSRIWNNEEIKEVQFSVFMRAGRVEK